MIIPGQEIHEPHAAFQGLEDVLSFFYYKPDFQATRIMLGAIQAHYLNAGDPVWLFFVAPPGTGKTTMNIMAVAALPQIISLSEFTESTFLSGLTGVRQPGILERLAEPKRSGNTFTTEGNAIFLAKDFTTVLSMRREKRAVILAQLREIHDGRFRRDFGTGESKIWHGRVTVVAAVTPALDRHYSIFSTLGERFLQVRAHRPDSSEAGSWAIRQQGIEETIREMSQDEVKTLFGSAYSGEPILPPQFEFQIVNLAEFTAIARTHVYRNSYQKREIEYVPEPEANTRISKGLAAIAKGIASLNRRSEVAQEDLDDALRVGVDCIPDYRLKLLDAAMKNQLPSALPFPRTIRDREIEELEGLSLLKQNSRTRLALSDQAEQLLDAAGLLS